jgi:hypothetical protein
LYRGLFIPRKGSRGVKKINHLKLVLRLKALRALPHVFSTCCLKIGHNISLLKPSELSLT